MSRVRSRPPAHIQKRAQRRTYHSVPPSPPAHIQLQKRAQRGTGPNSRTEQNRAQRRTYHSVAPSRAHTVTEASTATHISQRRAPAHGTHNKSTQHHTTRATALRVRARARGPPFMEEPAPPRPGDGQGILCVFVGQYAAGFLPACQVERPPTPHTPCSPGRRGRLQAASALSGVRACGGLRVERSQCTLYTGHRMLM